MSTNVGERALAGFDEYIIVCCFEITEEMTLEFKGLSCNIENPDGPDEELGPEKELVRRKVYPGYRCYVLKAWMSFKKADAIDEMDEMDETDGTEQTEQTKQTEQTNQP